MSTSITASTRKWGLVGLSVAVASAALQATPAAAAPSAPVITDPWGIATNSPEITWEATPGATGYEVQVDGNADFSSPEWKSATTNTVSVPLEPLAVGEQHVRVRAKDSSSAWSDWSQASFTVGPVDGPALGSPADGAELAQPDEPPLLTWDPVPGAKSYTVEIDDERAFVGATSYTTSSTSLVVPDNQSPQVTYHWRVRATLATNIFSNVSDTRTYTVFALPAPKVVGPSNDEDITDVVLDWEPVAGAKHYQLQVDDDHDFSSPETGIPVRIFSTAYSPSTTFGNDQYYWRVRAVDADENPSPWVSLADGDHYEFDRVWRDRPTLVHPSDPTPRDHEGDRALETVGDDLYFEWTPVRNASHYELWLSTDPNFTHPSKPVVTWQCQIHGTTYTPGEFKDDCMPQSEGVVYYWKVRPLDLPYRGGLEGIFSEAQSFVYRDQTAITITSPVPGTPQGPSPTVTWEPVQNTDKYAVELLDGTGGISKATTVSTSYTAPKELDPKKGPYRWRITALDAAGRTTAATQSTVIELGAGPSADELPPLEPLAGPATFDAPRLTWGASHDPAFDHYRVHVADAATGLWFLPSYADLLSTKWKYPSATDISARFLTTGRYDWKVTAHASDGRQIDEGPTATFEVAPLGPVRGQRIALTGSALDDGAVCAKTLADGASNWCDSVPTTPVLDWEPVPYASFYRVYVSRDGDFTTGALDEPVSTVNTRWTPRATYKAPSFPDSQASTAYYWFIQPCKSSSQCGPDPRSTINPSKYAFRKTSPTVALTAPARDAEVTSTEVTFAWTDYLETNRRTVYSETGETSTQSAMSYTIEVATEPTFTKPLDSATVDQTTYTASATMYPEGPLYWRVQPVDAAKNKLGWSETRTLTKSSPTTELLSPVARAEVTGSVPFTWKAQPFASSYEIQVAANEDANFSPANLVVNTLSSKRSAWTTGQRVTPLLPSENPYLWRVRTVAPSGHQGRWSEPERFVVAAVNPELVSPGPDATVGPRALTLRWKTAPGVARYRVTHRRAGTTSPVTSATTYARTFAPTSLAVETSYEWRVEALDAANKVLGDSGWRSFTVGGPPTATVAPAVEGSGLLGTDLTVTAPTWTREGVANTYQWRRDGSPIEGANGTTYAVTVADVGRSLTVQVTGTSTEFGTGTSQSNSVIGLPGAGPETLTPVTIAGPGAVGTTLVSTQPTWDRDDVVVTQQWLRNGTPIWGATGESYTLVPADVNAALTLRVTGTAVGRQPTEVLSNAVTGVPGEAPQVVAPPTVTGTPKVGETLAATLPIWGLSGVSAQRQWLRDGEPVGRATGMTYVLGVDDVGRDISVQFTGTKAGHVPGQVTSEAVTVQLGDAPSARSLPSVSGTPKVGASLSVSTPSWSLTGVTPSIQWLRDGVTIPDATATTYAPVAADVDRTLSVRVVGTRPGYADGSTESNGVTVLLGDPATPRSPATLTGTPKVGSTLSVTAPVWSRTDVEATRVWLRDGEPIVGEVGSTYRLTAADLGARISVRHVGAVAGHHDATTVSAAMTVLLGDAPVADQVEAPSGKAEVGETLTAESVAWSLPDVDETHQWLRDGQPIVGATAETYVVTKDDAGRKISVRTTATLAGYATGTVTSAAVTVAKPVLPPVVVPKPAPVASKTTVVVAKKIRTKGKPRARVKVTVKITATGTTPTGMVQIRVGKRVVGKGALKNGRIVVRLKALKVGRHTLTVTYAGSSTVKASTTKRKIRIVKR